MYITLTFPAECVPSVNAAIDRFGGGYCGYESNGTMVAECELPDLDVILDALKAFEAARDPWLTANPEAA